MLKVNVNISEMRQGQPGVRVQCPGKQQMHYDTVEFTAPPKLIAQGGACWLETDAPVIGKRRAGVANANKIPLDTIDWATVKEQPNHQVAMKVTPTHVLANDGSDRVIVPSIEKGYRFFWGHGHLHIEWVGENAEDIVEVIDP